MQEKIGKLINKNLLSGGIVISWIFIQQVSIKHYVPETESVPMITKVPLLAQK